MQRRWLPIQEQENRNSEVQNQQGINAEVALALARLGSTSVCLARAHEQHREAASSPSVRRRQPPPGRLAQPRHTIRRPMRAPPLHLVKKPNGARLAVVAATHRGDVKTPVTGSVESLPHRGLVDVAPQGGQEDPSVVVDPVESQRLHYGAPGVQHQNHLAQEIASHL